MLVIWTLCLGTAQVRSSASNVGDRGSSLVSNGYVTDGNGGAAGNNSACAARSVVVRRRLQAATLPPAVACDGGRRQRQIIQESVTEAAHAGLAARSQQTESYGGCSRRHCRRQLCCGLAAPAAADNDAVFLNGHRDHALPMIFIKSALLRRRHPSLLFWINASSSSLAFLLLCPRRLDNRPGKRTFFI